MNKELKESLKDSFKILWDCIELFLKIIGAIAVIVILYKKIFL